VYDADLVRRLCERITLETDPEKVQELVAVLQAAVKGDDQEIRLRRDFLSGKYAGNLGPSSVSNP